MRATRFDIAVVGAGPVGAATAYRLATAGRRVALVEAAGLDGPPSTEPAAAAGSVGLIADYAVAPLANPDTLREVWPLLRAQDSRLRIRWTDFGALGPWLARFAAQMGDAAATRAAGEMAALLATATAEWRTLLQRIGEEGLLRETGVLHIEDDPDAVEDAPWRRRVEAAHGVPTKTLGAGELSALEPALASNVRRARLYAPVSAFHDPGALLRRLRGAAITAGASPVRCAARRLCKDGPRLRVEGRGAAVEADAVVVTAGIGARALAASFGDTPPLIADNGHHLEYAPIGRAAELTRPTTIAGSGVYLTPMKDEHGRRRLRAAGLSDLSAGPSPAAPERLDRIDALARQVFPELGPPTASWSGARPATPDGKPLIGRSRRAMGVVYAVGHGHWGITLAATTARLVEETLSGGADPAVAAAVDPLRFS